MLSSWPFFNALLDGNGDGLYRLQTQSPPPSGRGGLVPELGAWNVWQHEQINSVLTAYNCQEH